MDSCQHSDEGSSRGLSGKQTTSGKVLDQEGRRKGQVFMWGSGEVAGAWKLKWIEKLEQLVYGAVHPWISDFVISYKLQGSRLLQQLQQIQYGFIISFHHSCVITQFVFWYLKKKLLPNFKCQYSALFSCSWQNLILSPVSTPYLQHYSNLYWVRFTMLKLFGKY